jgi:hypothetical protein
MQRRRHWTFSSFSSCVLFIFRSMTSWNILMQVRTHPLLRGGRGDRPSVSWDGANVHRSDGDEGRRRDLYSWACWGCLLDQTTMKLMKLELWSVGYWCVIRSELASLEEEKFYEWRSLWCHRLFVTSDMISVLLKMTSMNRGFSLLKRNSFPRYTSWRTSFFAQPRTFSLHLWFNPPRPPQCIYESD